MGNITDFQKSGLAEDYSNKIKKYNISPSFDDKLLDEINAVDSLNFLNEGTFSSVYSFRDKYAIKMVKNNLCKNLDIIPEISILLSLKSDNIINCYGTFIYNEKLCFIMDKYSCTLNEYIFNSLENKKSVIEQITSGLKFLHDNSILHLDLCCKNILINDNGIPKAFISDFSLSCKTNNLQIYSKNSKISPINRPYENLKGSNLYSDKSDIWSLGIIIYRILNDRCIFESCVGINVNSLYNENMSYIFHIDKLVSWNLWPPKFKDVDFSFDFDDYLNLDQNKRLRLSDNKINKQISYSNLFDNINITARKKLINYRYDIEGLYNKLYQRIFIEKHSLRDIFRTNMELYEFCIVIILSLYDINDDILQFINSRIINYLLEILEIINFDIINN